MWALSYGAQTPANMGFLVLSDIMCGFSASAGFTEEVPTSVGSFVKMNTS